MRGAGDGENEEDMSGWTNGFVLAPRDDEDNDYMMDDSFGGFQLAGKRRKR